MKDLARVNEILLRRREQHKSLVRRQHRPQLNVVFYRKRLVASAERKLARIWLREGSGPACISKSTLKQQRSARPAGVTGDDASFLSRFTEVG